jgi:hypothetical protein
MRGFTTLAIAAALFIASSGVSVAERNLESGSADSEPDLSCSQIIAKKAEAGKDITSEHLAAKLKISVDRVNQCLGTAGAPGSDSKKSSGESSGN